MNRFPTRIPGLMAFTALSGVNTAGQQFSVKVIGVMDYDTFRGIPANATMEQRMADWQQFSQEHRVAFYAYTDHEFDPVACVKAAQDLGADLVVVEDLS